MGAGWGMIPSVALQSVMEISNELVWKIGGVCANTCIPAMWVGHSSNSRLHFKPSGRRRYNWLMYVMEEGKMNNLS